MTIVVSINQFRQNMADYITKIKEGHTVILKDEKKDQQVAQLSRKKSFNPDSFGDALKAATGVFSEQNHPEWQTKEKISNWLEEERKDSDRSF